MPKRKTCEEFIIEAKQIHSDPTYSYDKVIYVNSKTPVKIVCSEHGEFRQTPNSHISKQNGCPKCASNHLRQLFSKSYEQFIDEAKQIHNDVFIYNKINYINSKTKVCIICKIHGEFYQTPNAHLQGAICPLCANIKVANSNRLSQEEFIRRSNEVHSNKYVYSLAQYNSYSEKVLIVCLEHGEFYQIAGNHLAGAGCQQCGTNKARSSLSINFKEFVERSKIKHGNTYEYYEEEYHKYSESTKIKCTKHGIFFQTPVNHATLGYGCQLCGRLQASEKCRKSQAEFIEQAKSVHSDKYSYDNIIYINQSVKISINCHVNDHGEFWQDPKNHLNGAGCPKCGKISVRESRLIPFEEFVSRANKCHSLGSYSYFHESYTQFTDLVKIHCIKHSIIFQTPAFSHVTGTGCVECTKEKLSISISKTQEEFLVTAKNKRGITNFDYSLAKYSKCDKKVLIGCLINREHGYFSVTPTNFYRGLGCSKCSVNGYSNAQILWLNFIRLSGNIEILDKLHGGETRIGKYRVDGFCSIKNTVYEFYGCFWHGCLQCFPNRNEINAVNKTNFEQLYQRTNEREIFIKSLGYKLVVIWEHEWINFLQKVVCIQRKFKQRLQ